MRKFLEPYDLGNVDWSDIPLGSVRWTVEEVELNPTFRKQHYLYTLFFSEGTFRAVGVVPLQDRSSDIKHEYLEFSNSKHGVKAVFTLAAYSKEEACEKAQKYYDLLNVNKDGFPSISVTQVPKGWEVTSHDGSRVLFSREIKQTSVGGLYIVEP